MANLRYRPNLWVLNMQTKEYTPTNTDRLAASAQSRRLVLTSYLRIKGASKPVYNSRFRPTTERLEEIVSKGEELAVNSPTEGKVFRQW